MTTPETRPVALCPACQFNDLFTAADEPVPAICDECAAEAGGGWERSEC
jgi:hypothetical protein